jgi:hypothetical protein
MTDQPTDENDFISTHDKTLGIGVNARCQAHVTSWILCAKYLALSASRPMNGHQSLGWPPISGSSGAWALRTEFEATSNELAIIG